MLTNECKLFIRYLVKSNMRLYVTIWGCLFVAFPFFVSILYGFEGSAQIYIITLLSGMIIACLAPIYFWRFLYTKRSADLYYSLPMKRSDMFYIIFFTGFVLIVLPVMVNLMIARMIHFNTADWIIHSDFFLFLLYPITSLFILYAIVTWIVQQCNNLLDAIIVGAFYMVVPLIFIGSLAVFFNNQFNNFMIGSGSYVTELPFYKIIPWGFSVIYTLIYSFFTFIESKPGYLLMMYWLAVAIVCMIYGNKSFNKRKQEDSEQRTTAWWTYPSIICLSIFSLILLIMNTSWTLWYLFVTSVCTFVLYLCMVFFSKRKIKITRYNILFFISIYAGSWAVSYVFQETKGFHIVQEVPGINNISTAQISFNQGYGPVDKNSLNIKYQLTDDSESEILLNNLVGFSQSQRDIEELLKQQKVIMEKQKEFGNQGEMSRGYYFILTYETKNKHNISRYYETTKEDAVEILGKLFTSNAKKETSFKLEFKQQFK